MMTPCLGGGSARFVSHMLLTALALASVHLATAQPSSNPLLAPSSLPFGYPPFDKIKDEHYTPAFELGMKEHLMEVAEIANREAAPTFENTIVALERSGLLLARVSTVFDNLTGAHTNP